MRFSRGKCTCIKWRVSIARHLHKRRWARMNIENKANSQHILCLSESCASETTKILFIFRYISSFTLSRSLHLLLSVSLRSKTVNKFYTNWISWKCSPSRCVRRASRSIQFFSLHCIEIRTKTQFSLAIHGTTQPKIMNRKQIVFCVCVRKLLITTNFSNYHSYERATMDATACTASNEQMFHCNKKKRYHFYWHRFQWHRHVLFVKWLCTISCCDTCIAALNVRDFVSRGGSSFENKFICQNALNDFERYTMDVPLPLLALATMPPCVQQSRFLWKKPNALELFCL